MHQVNIEYCFSFEETSASLGAALLASAAGGFWFMGKAAGVGTREEEIGALPC